MQQFPIGCAGSRDGDRWRQQIRSPALTRRGYTVPPARLRPLADQEGCWLSLSY